MGHEIKKPVMLRPEVTLGGTAAVDYDGGKTKGLATASMGLNVHWNELTLGTEVIGSIGDGNHFLGAAPKIGYYRYTTPRSDLTIGVGVEAGPMFELTQDYSVGGIINGVISIGASDWITGPVGPPWFYDEIVSFAFKLTTTIMPDNISIGATAGCQLVF